MKIPKYNSEIHLQKSFCVAVDWNSHVLNSTGFFGIIYEDLLNFDEANLVELHNQINNITRDNT